MVSQLIVTTVSDQTQPNVLLIKEYGDAQTEHLFLSTKKMNSNGIPQRIERACGIQHTYMCEVESDSRADVINKLDALHLPFDSYEKIIVNLTGGTKAMSLAVFSYFEGKPNATLLYKPTDNFFIDFRTNEHIEIKTRLTIEEYLTAYGITPEREKPSGVSPEQTDIVYSHFIHLNLLDYFDQFSFLREKRGRKIIENDFCKVEKFVNAIHYKPITGNQLSKEEIVYLSGGWFEEWLKQHLQQQLNLSYEHISGGMKMSSDNPRSKWKNDIKNIIGQEPEKEDVPNELDVVIMYENTLYTIECKSSVFDIQVKEEAGTDGQKRTKLKERNILGETIFKSDSLQKLFGLRPQTVIMTLTNIDSECKKDTSKLQSFINSLNRANLSNIRIVDLQQIESKKDNLFELIKQ